MKWAAPILAALLIAATGALPATAQTFDEALAAYERGDHAAAFRGFRAHAEQGNADAQFNLGLMYDNGQGVAQDYAQALRWYRLAAEQGNAAAQLNLGAMYNNGQGVVQDLVEAHKWFNLATSRFASADQDRREKAVRNRDRAASRLTRPTSPRYSAWRGVSVENKASRKCM